MYKYNQFMYILAMVYETMKNKKGMEKKENFIFIDFKWACASIIIRIIWII